MTFAGRPAAGTDPWDWYFGAWSHVPLVLWDPGSLHLHGLTRFKDSEPRAIMLHYRLTERQRRNTLAHELHHIAVGGVCSSECPENEALVAVATIEWLG